MRSPRRVTITPIFMPSRSLKVAMSFLARDDHRRLAGDELELLEAVLDHLGSSLALPRPMLTETFKIRGTCIDGRVVELLRHRRRGPDRRTWS